MSTYLVAFIVSEMSIVSGNNTAAPPTATGPDTNVPATVVQSTTAAPITETTVSDAPVVGVNATVAGNSTAEASVVTETVTRVPVNGTDGGMSSAFTTLGNDNSSRTATFGSTTTNAAVEGNGTSGATSTETATAGGEVSVAENSTTESPGDATVEVSSRLTTEKTGITSQDDRTTERVVSTTTVRSPASTKVPGVIRSTVTTSEGREVTKRPDKATEHSDPEEETVTRYDDVTEKTKLPKEVNDTVKPSTTTGTIIPEVSPLAQRLRFRRSDVTKGKHIPVRMVVRPHLASQASYAIEITSPLLDFYGEYFGVPYDLPKMDLAAVPDFQAGAMENWGLVTFRSVKLSLYFASKY